MEIISILCLDENKLNQIKFLNHLKRQSFKDYKVYFPYEDTTNTSLSLFKKAQGKYVLFTDTFVTYHDDFLSHMVRKGEEDGASCIICGTKQTITYPTNASINAQVLLQNPYLGNKLFLRSFIKEDYFLNCTSLYDLSLVPILLLKANKIAYVKEKSLEGSFPIKQLSLQELRLTLSHLTQFFNDEFYYELEYSCVNYLKQYRNKQINQFIKEEFPYYRFNMYRKKLEFFWVLAETIRRGRDYE